MTQDVIIKACAKISFNLAKTAELPSGLRRCLQRVDMLNLPKGHADIELVPPPEDDKEERDAATPHLELKATVRYADIKLKIGEDRALLISAFGKRGMLFNMPAYLDKALQPFRTHLARATTDSDALGKALKARAMMDALNLKLEGKTNPNDLRRLYPVGLSIDMAKEIMKLMDAALRHMTARLRLIVAGISFLLGAGAMAWLYLTPLYLNLAFGHSLFYIRMLDIAPPLAVMAASWFGMAYAMRWALNRKFPGVKIRLSQNLGKTGYIAVGALGLSYFVIRHLLPRLF